ncbi:MAG: hypothetical protein HYX72_08435 [Acidobacteria bacterium]|nr:hypothetical protein [Acidobacteriota bacterium]
MLSSFPAELRKHGLHADVRTILQLYTLMSRGLVQDLGTLYSFGERLVVKDPRQKGPYTVAFFAHFLDVHTAPGQSLDDAVITSDVFHHWRLKHAPGSRQPTPQLIDEFLDFVLSRRPGFTATSVPLNPGYEDRPEIDVPFAEMEDITHEAEFDWSDMDLAEIIRKMKEIAEKQKESHSGGHKYIGTHGTTPYGHNGRAKDGVRVGGRSVHLSARMVLNDPRYFPVDLNALLSDNNVDAALAALKGVAERTSRLELDLEETIRWGAKRGGLFIPHLKNEEDDRFNVMLFIDNGGFSMDPYIPVVRTLFQKMKTRFGHDLRIFYFHNIIDGTVYKDQARTKEPVMTESLLREGQHHSVFIVGDASMAPYELHAGPKSGFDYVREMAETFPRFAWLNPVAEGAWGHTETINDIRTIVKMFPLTPRGIERAVRYLNQSSARAIEEK